MALTSRSPGASVGATRTATPAAQPRQPAPDRRAWDAAGAYQLGRAFPGITACQWNGRFRADVRSFVRGDPGMVPLLMRRLYGSDDLFPDDRMHAYRQHESVNYIGSHDGFTLYDLVAYT
jgi:glycogen operon protein